MSESARAVLFCRTADGQVFGDEFVEDDTHDLDPYHRAQALQRGIKDDWPGAIWSIGLNRRAQNMMRDTRLVQMGLAPLGADVDA